MLELCLLAEVCVPAFPLHAVVDLALDAVVDAQRLHPEEFTRNLAILADFPNPTPHALKGQGLLRAVSPEAYKHSRRGSIQRLRSLLPRFSGGIDEQIWVLRS